MSDDFFDDVVPEDRPDVLDGPDEGALSDLDRKRLEEATCPDCGRIVEVGAWFACPHGRDVTYSFSGNFR